MQTGGAKRHTQHFLVFVAPQPPSVRARGPRFGLTVTKKVGNAVQRNRVKRLLREALRHHRKAFPTGRDVVWVAKRNAARVSQAQVMQEVASMASHCTGSEGVA